MQDKFIRRDPRTVAREIHGLVEAVFPQLNSSVVNSFNRGAQAVAGVRPPTEQQLTQCSMNLALLFEISSVRAEQLLAGDQEPDFDRCVEIGVQRQQRFYAAKKPVSMTNYDVFVIRQTSKNLYFMLREILSKHPSDVVVGPRIKGVSWIASGRADFAIANRLVEVKHSAHQFSLADFRQVLVYWLLDYLGALEASTARVGLTDCVLLNPRRNRAVAFRFSKLVRIASAGLNMVEASNKFLALVGDQRALITGWRQNVV